VFSCSTANVSVHYNLTYELKKLDDGLVYMIFTDYDADIITQHMVAHLDNLFGGNQVLGELAASTLTTTNTFGCLSTPSARVLIPFVIILTTNISTFPIPIDSVQGKACSTYRGEETCIYGFDGEN
jgi:hypothetical protein